MRKASAALVKGKGHPKRVTDAVALLDKLDRLLNKLIHPSWIGSLLELPARVAPCLHLLLRAELVIVEDDPLCMGLLLHLDGTKWASHHFLATLLVRLGLCLPPDVEALHTADRER